MKNNELSSYMRDVVRHPQLTREEECVLGKKARCGNKKALDKLVVSNLRFVVRVANQFKGYTTSGKYTILDLVQEGNHGLIRAVKKFDERKGFRLITYAVWQIRAYIQKFIIRNFSAVKIGTTYMERRLFFKIGKLKDLESIVDTDQKQEGIVALADELGIEPGDIEKMMIRISWNDVSIDKEIKTQKTTATCHIILVDPTDGRDLIEARDECLKSKDILDEMLSTLDKREQNIIRMRWLSEDGMTLQKLAGIYKLSRERIRQIESKAFEKMRCATQGSEVIDRIIRSKEQSSSQHAVG